MLAYRGKARVDGCLKGDVICQGSLVVGPDARIEGAVSADELVVHGCVIGDSDVRRRIELAATARVFGAIRAPVVSIADGSILEGRCETPTPAESEAPA